MDLSENTFHWFKEINSSEEFTQGDIITDCLIPQVNEEVYNSILNENESTSILDIKKADLIVLSQACDIKNKKIDFIILCSI